MRTTSFVLIIMMLCGSVSATTLEDLLHDRDASLSECMSHLPAHQSIAWRDSKGRGTFPAACRDAKLGRDDVRDMKKYRDDLMKMFDASPNKPVSRDVAQQEADDIARRMVQTTRTLSQKFDMIHSAILNNLLVNIGSKKGGQCYQWVRGLLADLPPKPYAAFERTWGGSRIHRFLENNSVIFTLRGQPLATGILYDAWRAHGNPWWRKVSKDHYPWDVRFSEEQILSGDAQVTGVAEVKNTPKTP